MLWFYISVSWDEKCSDNNLREISDLITDWREVSPFLSLTPAEEQEIVACNPSLPVSRQKTKMLNIWMQKNGKGATYRKLAEIFRACKRQDIVDMIEELVTAGTGEGWGSRV